MPSMLFNNLFLQTEATQRFMRFLQRGVYLHLINLCIQRSHVYQKLRLILSSCDIYCQENFKSIYKFIKINNFCMVEHQRTSSLTQLLLRYYQIRWWRIANTVLYFLVQILLFVVLTFLPIKLTFSWLFTDYSYIQQSIDIGILVVFVLHIYLYLDHKVKRLVQNPEMKKKLLFQNRVVRLKWLSLLTPELIYDIICLIVAIYEIVVIENTLTSRYLELIYLPKVYKIVMFHNRFLAYIIGTPFYVIYNVFYGLFILIILVSYVGCIFYQIDHSLYNSNYPNPELLWVVSSAWNDIIDQSFGIQLEYTIYWSLGTASSAAYGNVAASAPQDVIFNIICLYFEGFLFGFYLSRIHSLPELISRKQNQLLELFQKFQAHNAEVRINQQGETISQQLYFKILCSLEYQQSRKKSLSEIETILPEAYVIQIKTEIFHQLLILNPLNLWQDDQLRQRLSLQIRECITEVGEQVYDYSDIERTDLVFLKEGRVKTQLQLDHQMHFSCNYEAGKVFGLFNFVTGIQLDSQSCNCQEYCNLYIIKRSDYKKQLSLQEKVYFEQSFTKMITFQDQFALTESIGQYEHSLNEQGCDVLFLNPHRKAHYIQSVMNRNSETKFRNNRKRCVRSKFNQRKVLPFQLGKQRNVGIQWPQREQFINLVDTVLIF